MSAEKPLLVYLHFSDNSPGEEGTLELSNGDKASVIWKDVLVEGEYPLTPGATGPIKRTLTVVAEGESSREQNTVAMSDLINAHDDGAFKYVTVPLKHRDEPMDNTGYVPRPHGVRVVEKTIDGKTAKVMQAALGFTEPDVKGKVQRGTIPDCSAGIFFNWLNKHKNKRYRAAMKHVSLTPTPFLGNLDPFPAIFANDPDVEEEVQIQHFMFDDGTGDSGTGGSADDSSKGDVVWNESASMAFIRAAIDGQLNPKQQLDEGLPAQPRPSYYTRDVSTEDTALVEEFFKGEQRKFVIPYTREGDNITVAPATRWVEVREAMIAADDYMSAEVIKDKLAVMLTDVFGGEADRFAVKDLSLDHRVKIVNKDTKAEYLASFVLLSDESVAIESAANWERVKAPEQRVQPVAPSVGLSDQPDLSTPKGRVEAARKSRQQRRQRSAR
jgi:hypothetical protein